MKKAKQKKLFEELYGYSTIFDALFLLVLISLAGVLLMPSMQAEKQYSAAGYVTSSELDIYMLESLLSCKLEDFEYEISPLSVLNISEPDNSVVESPSKTLFTKEQKHRTFADFVAEYLALSLALYEDSTAGSSGSSFSLNPLAADYCLKNSEVISTYLDYRVAGRFTYRFEAYWQPVEVFPLKSELIVGEEPPTNAFRQSAKLSMPLYAGTSSKDTLLACVNDSLLESSLNMPDNKASKLLFNAFNASLDAAAQEGTETILTLLFPSDYSGTVFGEESGESLQTILYGVSENPENNSTSAEEAFALYISGTYKTGFPLDSGISPENESTFDLYLLEKPMEIYVKNRIRAELEIEFSDEINGTVSAILKAENLSEAQTLRDSLINTIYRKINPGGARIILSIWRPVS